MAEFVPPAGPVDIAVVGFPEPPLISGWTAALADVVASGAVRVLDALVVEKAADGGVTVIDVDDPADSLELLGYPTDLPGLLSEEDAKAVLPSCPMAPRL